MIFPNCAITCWWPIWLCSHSHCMPVGYCFAAIADYCSLYRFVLLLFFISQFKRLAYFLRFYSFYSLPVYSFFLPLSFWYKSTKIDLFSMGNNVVGLLLWFSLYNHCVVVVHRFQFVLLIECPVCWHIHLFLLCGFVVRRLSMTAVIVVFPSESSSSSSVLK